MCIRDRITGIAFTYFYKKGVSEKLLLPILIFWSCLLPVQQVSCYLFKDVFFAIGLLAVTFILIRSLDKKKDITYPDVILSGIALAAITLFRHNGIVITIACLAISLYFTFAFSKKHLVTILTLLLIIIPVKTVVYGAFDVQPNDNGTKWALPAKAIASVVFNNGNYTEEQLAQIEQLMPEEAIRMNYDRKEGQRLIWKDLMQDVGGEKYSFADTLAGKEEMIIKLFLQLYPKNFFIMTWDILGSASLMLQFQGNLLENNALYMFCLLAAIVLLWIQKKRLAIIAFIPCFANIASLVISNISFEPRYGYPTIICFAVLMIYAYVTLAKEKTA